MKLKLKTFGPVYVFHDGTEKMTFAFADPAQKTEYPPFNTPVDTMIASLGSCIVKSMAWSAAQHKAELHDFHVVVTAVKAADLPSRVGKISLEIVGKFVDDEALAPEIIKQAKSVCTVSNSLNCEVEITTS
ncbi:OsmC family protein [Maritalea mediterranea]|uniref:OsmC family protein n=1 Tax=Maritalea mediterranea TaxID=2909667 RepID=A0ABS9E8W7_9HYPH|nr:OsmC family protein [Maritalea mediterranea]MCF4099325.1 OsmC family protein [Maritalea mediterranea]